MKPFEQVLARYGLAVENKFYERAIKKELKKKSYQIPSTLEKRNTNVQKAIFWAFANQSIRLTIEDQQIFHRVFETSRISTKIPECMWEQVRLRPYKSMPYERFYFTVKSHFSMREHIEQRMAKRDGELEKIFKRQIVKEKFSKTQTPEEPHIVIAKIVVHGLKELDASIVFSNFNEELFVGLVEQFQDSCVFGNGNEFLQFKI